MIARPARGVVWHLALIAAGALAAVPAFAQSYDDALLPEAVRQAIGAPATVEVPPLAPTLGDGPIDPAAYRLGPGDELTVRYRGRITATHRLTISPEGDVYLPDVGRIALAGRTLDDGRQTLAAAARRILNSVSVDVDLTRVRAFKVNVTGAVARPGVYAATGATRLFEILRLAGGVGDSAAVRDIRLVDSRTGAATPVDLLPFILTGGPPTSNPYLPDGVTVVVPIRVNRVHLAGALVHPGTYDLPVAGTTLGEVVGLAGLVPEAATDRIELVRSGPGGFERRAGTLAELGALRLAHGDRVSVPRIGGRPIADLVTVDGEVGFPGSYALDADTLRLSDLLTRAGGTAPGALRSRIVLARPALSDTLTPDARRMAPFPNVPLTMTEREQLRARGVNGYRAVIVDLSRPGEPGPVLVAGDRILVPRRGSYVEVTGRVRHPGFYPWRSGAEARDYIADAGGWANRADKRQTRVAAGPGDNFRTADDAGPPEPGDQVWVPEKNPRSTWENIRDAVLVAGQLATIVLLVDQLNN